MQFFGQKLAFKKFAVRKNIHTFAVPKRKQTVNVSLAQLVEHDTLNVGVQGSRPWRDTKRG